MRTSELIDRSKPVELDAPDHEEYDDDGELDEFWKAIYLLRSVQRLMSTLSDKDIVPKLLRVDRERMAKLANKILEFTEDYGEADDEPTAPPKTDEVCCG